MRGLLMIMKMNTMVSLIELRVPIISAMFHNNNERQKPMATDSSSDEYRKDWQLITDI